MSNHGVEIGSFKKVLEDATALQFFDRDGCCNHNDSTPSRVTYEHDPHAMGVLRKDKATKIVSLPVVMESGELTRLKVSFF
jgi:hypothetical protein